MISDRTRKILWSKSGNLCALCRIELVQDVENTSEKLVIGMECHIISKRNGPRSDQKYNGDYDGYENLILLCPNDHKKIDGLVENYPTSKLRLLKSNHEAWIKTTLEQNPSAFANDRLNIKSLERINSGRHLFELVRGAHVFDFNHDDLFTEDEAELIGSFFEDLQDNGDILSDMGYSETAKYEIHLNQEIKKILELGFILYGIRRNARYWDGSGNELGEFDTATVVAARKDHPAIIGNFLIAKFKPRSKLYL
ncbi:HNH endonuclease [Flavobacterium fluviale]|uniref:HNH endonuclease n=1 Tax=Flavobacterium fluviale TaxID=2249356 RepID=UPI0013B3EB48|nr:hypothetical protein [Flavobacterium fluviale]